MHFHPDTERGQRLDWNVCHQALIRGRYVKSVLLDWIDRSIEREFERKQKLRPIRRR